MTALVKWGYPLSEWSPCSPNSPDPTQPEEPEPDQTGDAAADVEAAGAHLSVVGGA